MGSEILINVTRGETRVGLLEGGQVVEFYVERKRDASLVGNIYKGKVVTPQIGSDESSFSGEVLPFANLRWKVFANRTPVSTRTIRQYAIGRNSTRRAATTLLMPSATRVR